MTVVKEIAGINKPVRQTRVSEMGGQELRQRGREVTEMGYVNTAWLSTDEAIVQLIGEQYRILYEFYGDPVYLKGYQMAEDALAAGLHSAVGLRYFGANFNPKLEKIASAITAGAMNTSPRPASGFLTWKERGRTKLHGLDVPYYTKAEAVQVLSGIGSLVPMLDCNSIKVPSYQEWVANGVPPGYFPNPISYNEWKTSVQPAYQKKKDRCIKENEYRKLFNERFTQIAHHPLYNFMTAGQANSLSGLGAGKPVFHHNAIAALATISEIDLGLITTWQETAIVQRNATGGAGPIDGEDSITAVMQGAYNKEHGIGDFGATIAIIGAIVTILATVAETVKMFMTDMEQQFPTSADYFKQQTQGFTQPGWGSQFSDFVTKYLDTDDDGIITTSEAASGLMPVVLIGAGAMLLASGKKNN